MTIPNRPRLADLVTMPVGAVTALPAETLALLQEEADEALRAAKTVKDWLDGALALKYGSLADQARAVAGKDTGTVRFADGQVTIVADLPKRVEWDQSRLAALVDRYDTVFIDSITVAGRLCLQWCKGQPEAFSDRTGRPDKRASRQRIDPLIEESPAIRERVKPARSRDAGNTMLSKDFPGGTLVLTGANSAVGLRSMPARYLFLDEVDAYPASADEEGDPVGLAEARSLTFAHRRKVFLASTPTIRGLSRIEREYETSDQRRFFLPCPHCGAMQWLKFERLRWDKGRPETVRYHCEVCDQEIEEHHKAAMLAGGVWRATAIAANPGTIGFHISALYSPPGWQSWREIARLWESAQGNDDALRVFRNTVLGETWVESGEAPDWQRLYDRRETWGPGTVPAGGLFLTAGADVQKDRVEIDVWAWGRGLESWLVDHVVIEGGPEHAETWIALERVLGQTWAHASGAALRIARLAIDTGYEASAVYAWGRKMGVGQVSPIKGVEGFNRSSPVSGPTYVDATEGGKKIRRGARLWIVAVSTFKSETYRYLRLARASSSTASAGASPITFFAAIPATSPIPALRERPSAFRQPRSSM